MLDGAGWSVGLAAALFAFALLFLALDLQSPDSVLWTGQRAVGSEQNGLVTFYWKHHAYTATTPGSGSAKAVSVYFLLGNPDAAVAESLPGPAHRRGALRCAGGSPAWSCWLSA